MVQFTYFSPCTLVAINQKALPIVPDSSGLRRISQALKFLPCFIPINYKAVHQAIFL